MSADSGREEPRPRLLLPFDLPPEVVVLRERLRQHIAEELLPTEAAKGIATEAQVSADVRRQVRTRSEALGFLRLPVPLEEGGGGLGPLGLTVVREEVARSGSVLARFLFARGPGILRHATGAQRERYLLPVLRGERSYAFAFTEPREAGERTTARRDGDTFVLNGTKSFVTDGPFADFLLVLAGVLDQAGAFVGAAMFLIDRETPGLAMGRVLETMEGGVHAVYHLQDVHVPAGNMLGEIGQGMPRAMENIGLARLALAATASGTAWRVLDLTLTHVNQPHRSGMPLAQREGVQVLLAEMAQDTISARVMVYATATALEHGHAAEMETALAKMVATEAAGRVVDRAIQLHGGAAYVQGHPLERLYRSVRGWRIAEGTTEILKLSVARALIDPAAPRA